MDIVDGIFGRRTDIERSLHRPPEITFITPGAVDTSGMLNSDVIDIECAGLAEPVSIEVGVHTQSRLKSVCYVNMVSGMTLTSEEPKRTGSPVVLGRAVGKSDVLA